jgi:hypothetical protein
MFKLIGTVLAFTIGSVAVLIAIAYGMRAISNVNTPTFVEEVATGVSCARLVTADGAAISCWKHE